MLKHIAIVSFCTLLGCKAPVVNQQVHRPAKVVPELLSLGNQGLDILERPFQSVGSPKLSKPIRLDVQELAFNGTSFKAYAYHQKKKNKETLFALKDSLSPTPNYIQLSVLDRISLAETFNSNKNLNLRDYIMDDSNIMLVSSILFNATPQVTKQLLDAEEVYAIQDGESNIGIQLVKDGSVFAKLNLSELKPFSYAISNFCWGLDKRNRPELKAIINGSDCPTNTKSKAHKLESPYSYKF